MADYSEAYATHVPAPTAFSNKKAIEKLSERVDELADRVKSLENPPDKQPGPVVFGEMFALPKEEYDKLVSDLHLRTRQFEDMVQQRDRLDTFNNVLQSDYDEIKAKYKKARAQLASSYDALSKVRAGFDYEEDDEW